MSPANPTAAGQARTQVTRERLLARVIQAGLQAMEAHTRKETAAIIVNRVGDILPMDRAVLVRMHGRLPIEAVSGGGVVEQASNFADAVREARRRYREANEPKALPPEPEPGGSMHLRRVQKAMGGTSIVWLPLRLGRGKEAPPPAYALWLERWNGRDWKPNDLQLLDLVALPFGHAMVERRKTLSLGVKRLLMMGVLLALLVAMFIPVRSSVVAPVQVVPDRPVHVLAPLEGILRKLEVRPGQQVDVGTLLFSYDARVLDKQIDEGRRAVAVARAELARLEGAAFGDAQAQAQLPVQRLEVKRAEAELEFAQAQRRRADVRATVAGTVVLEDPESMIGAPLQVGQLVMSIADPTRTKLRIMVPAGDAGLLRKGADVEIRLDRNPLKSLPATVTRIGFDVRQSDLQIPSVLVEARWNQLGARIQPGQRGSAKLYSEPTALGMQIFRKPLVTLRMLTGL
jgi:biotin carboxyl carrier protein